ncbi:MAG TPA: hypothetical protein PLZ57_13260 [Pseudobdellovibrionaceae bacterium]|nr:hypothetical protein [Pseudobdellovibrionaceae bacterium]
MDSKSHVEFALRILSPGMEAAALTALFPQIDRRPATLHRNYAHHLAKVKALTRVGWGALSGVPDLAEGFTFPSSAEVEYVTERFALENHRIRSYLDVGIPNVINERFIEASEMAYVSHLYLDTFNQPVQAFVPSRSIVSGQFELWDKIGDFRYRLYVQGVVEELRAEWLKSSIWSTKFTAAEMTNAMIVRLAQLAGRQDEAFVDAAMRQAGFQRPAQSNSNTALAWLTEMETELSRLHMRYLA